MASTHLQSKTQNVVAPLVVREPLQQFVSPAALPARGQCHKLRDSHVVSDLFGL